MELKSYRNYNILLIIKVRLKRFFGFYVLFLCNMNFNIDNFSNKNFFFKLRRHFQKKYSIYYLAEHIFDFEIYHYIIYILVGMIDTVLSLKMPCEVQKKKNYFEN